MVWYDAHCHLPELAKSHDVADALRTASEKGIAGWLSCALNQEEVRWHKLNRIPGIRYSAGIHPLYDAGTPLEIADLENLISNKEIFAIGEIGLDKRNRQLDKQTALLKEQLALARSHGLPCVFHVVGHYDLFFKLLSDQPVRGIWHGFNASREIVKQFSGLGLTFSLGRMLIESLKHHLINEVISYGNYLLETDAPYNFQKQDRTGKAMPNPLLELLGYARTVSRLNGVKLESLQHDLQANAGQYFS